MEEVDQLFVSFVASQSSTAFQDPHAVGHFVELHNRSASAGWNAAVGARRNFLLDASTPHGDVVLSESSALKPSLGWVTCFVTESLRRGVHEWCIKVENQGETSDGSGLMLGIVPKHFSKFDSFISQGSGWCLSRAGKLYGHWRRVDNNTSVGSLTFGTGDRVIFQLDFESSRMTVRVGDRSITGEISNLTGEVYPAVSLHYRHQHVRFEYHRVHDRNVKAKTWIERWSFPSAAAFLPVTSVAQLRQLPIDAYVFHPSLVSYAEVEAAGADADDTDGLPNLMVEYQSRRDGELREDRASHARREVVMRALHAIRRFRQAEAGPADQYLSSSVTAALLRKTILGDVRRRRSAGSLFLSQMLLNVTSLNSPLMAATVASVVDHLLQQPLFCLQEGAADGLSADCVATLLARVHASTEALLAANAVGADHRIQEDQDANIASLCELQVVIAIHSGSVSAVLKAAQSLLLLHAVLSSQAQGRSACALPFSSAFSRWFATVEQRLAPRYNFNLVRCARRCSLDPSRMTPTPELSRQFTLLGLPLSFSAGKECWYLHFGTAGLQKWGSGSSGATPKLRGLTVEPSFAMQGAKYSTIACTSSCVLLHTDRLRAANLAVVVYDSTTLVVSRVVGIGVVPRWPASTCNTIKLLSSGSLVGVLAHYELSSADVEGLGDVDATQSLVSSRTTLALYQDFPSSLVSECTLRSSVPAIRERTCLLLSRDSVLSLGDPSRVLHFPGGHVTVELWFRAFHRHDEATSSTSPKMLYCHGEKSTTGEVFLELCCQDGSLCLKGGYRHESRGSSGTAVYIPPGSVGKFLHVALVFDGRWRVLLNGDLATNVLKPVSATPSLAVERPRVKWCLGGGCVAHVAELRVFTRARSVSEIQRDFQRSLIGDEVGLAAYFPLAERDGHTLYNYALNGQHAVLWSPFVREPVADHPVQQSESCAQVAAAAAESAYPLFQQHGVPLSSRVRREGGTVPATSSGCWTNVWGPFAKYHAALCCAGSTLVLMSDVARDALHGGKLLLHFNATTGEDGHLDLAVPETSLLHAGLWAFDGEDASREEGLWSLAADGSTACRLHVPAGLSHGDGALNEHLRELSQTQGELCWSAAEALLRKPHGPPAATPLLQVGVWCLQLLRRCAREAEANAHMVDEHQPVGLVEEQGTSMLTVSVVRESTNAHLLFAPLQRDVDAEVFRMCVAMLWDNIRVVQAPNARRITTPKDNMSPFVVDAVLVVLRNQLEALLRLRIDPRTLDLAIRVDPGPRQAKTSADASGHRGATPVTPPRPFMGADSSVTTVASNEQRTPQRRSTISGGGGGSALIPQMNSSLRMRGGGSSATLPPSHEPSGDADEGTHFDTTTSAEYSTSAMTDFFFTKPEATLGSRLVTILCELVNSDSNAFFPTTVHVANEVLRTGVILFFPDSSLRVSLLQEMLEANVSTSNSHRRPSIQALLGGVLDHFSSATSVAQIHTAPSLGLRSPLVWISQALIHDLTRRCQSSLTTFSDETCSLSNQGPTSVHRSTLEALGMVQLFLLSYLDRTGNAAGAEYRTRLQPAGTLPQDRSDARPPSTPGHHAPPPTEIAAGVSLPPTPATKVGTPTMQEVGDSDDCDVPLTEYFSFLFSHAVVVLERAASVLQSPQPEPSRVADNAIDVLRHSFTGNVLFTAVTAVPVVVSLPSSPWMLRELERLGDALATTLQRIQSAQATATCATADGGGKEALSELLAATRRQQSWLAAFMATASASLPAARGSTDAAREHSPVVAPWSAASTPVQRVGGHGAEAEATPTTGLPTSVAGFAAEHRHAPSGSEGVRTLCSHIALAGGITSMLDISARGQCCVDLACAPGEWRQKIHPVNVIDRAGSALVQRVWDYTVAVVLHLSAVAPHIERLEHAKRLECAARVAVECRRAKHELLRWVTDGATDADLTRTLEVLSLLLQARADYGRCLSTTAAAQISRSWTAGHDALRLQDSTETESRWRFAIRRVRRCLLLQRAALFSCDSLHPSRVVELLVRVLIPPPARATDSDTTISGNDATVEAAVWSPVTAFELQLALANQAKHALVRLRGFERLARESQVGASEASVRALQLLSSGAAAHMHRSHYLADVTGAPTSCREDIYSAIRAVLANSIALLRTLTQATPASQVYPATEIAARESRALEMASSLARLSSNLRWAPEDFALLTSSQLLDVLLHRCSPFLNEGTLKPEGAQERVHRQNARERQRGKGNAGSGGSEEGLEKRRYLLTGHEECARLCWAAIRELGVTAAELLEPTCTISVVHRRAVEGFLATLLDHLSVEVRRCNAYASHFYFPSQDRVSEHVAAVASIVAVVTKALASPRSLVEVGEPFRGVVGAALYRTASWLLLLSHSACHGSALPPAVAEVVLRTAGCVMVLCPPATLSEVLRKSVMELGPVGVAASDAATFARRILPSPLSAADLIVQIATMRIVPFCSDGIASGSCGAALHVLRQLALSDLWAPLLFPHVAACAMREFSVALSPEHGAEARREACAVVLALSSAVCGLDADVPLCGSEVRYVSDHELRLLEIGYVVEVNPLLQTAVVVPQNACDVSRGEIEVPVDQLHMSFGDHLPCFPVKDGLGQLQTMSTPFQSRRTPSRTQLANFCLPLLRSALAAWTAVCSNAMLVVSASSWLLSLSVLCQHDPWLCKGLAEDGTLRRVQDVVASRSISSILPLPYLGEVLPIAINAFLRPLSSTMRAPASTTTTGGDGMLVAGFDSGSADSVDSSTLRQSYRYTAHAMVAAAVSGVVQLSGTSITSSHALHVSLLAPDSEPLHRANISGRRGLKSCALPSAAMLCDRSASIEVPLPRRAGPVPVMPSRAHSLSSSGSTVDLTFYLHDPDQVTSIGEGLRVPVDWFAAPGAPTAKLLCLTAATGGEASDTLMLQFDIVHDKLVLHFDGPTTTPYAAPSAGDDGDDGSSAPPCGSDDDFDSTGSASSSPPPTARFPNRNGPTHSGVGEHLPRRAHDFFLMSLSVSECIERWTRLSFVFHECELLVYREGELVSAHSFEGSLDFAELPFVSCSIGGATEASNRDDADVEYAPLSIRGFLYWNVPLPKQIIRTLHDQPLDVTNSALLFGMTPAVQIRFVEGTGGYASSDDGETRGSFVGDVRWIPVLPLTTTAASLLTLDFDVEQNRLSSSESYPPPYVLSSHDGAHLVLPPVAELQRWWATTPAKEDPEERAVDATVPRKELALYYSAMDQPSLLGAVLHLAASVCGHYSRRAILHAAETLMSARAQAACGGNHDLRDLLRHGTDTVGAVGNLVRYSVGPRPADRTIATAMRMLESCIHRQLQEVQHDRSLQLDLIRSHVADALDLFNYEFEAFELELPATNPATTTTGGEGAVCPFAVLNGGAGTISFETPRSMEYLLLFADKQQKVSLAKLPDAQGCWPDFDISGSTWCFAKPSTSLRSSPAKFRCKVRSQRPLVGHLAIQLLCDVVQQHHYNSELCVALLDQRVLSLLGTWIRSTRGERRIGHMVTLTKLLLLWAAHPTVQPHDRTPLWFFVDRLQAFVLSCERRNSTQSQSNMTGLYPVVVRRAVELLCAASCASAAWRGVSVFSDCRAAYARVERLARSANEADESIGDCNTRRSGVSLVKLSALAPSTNPSPVRRRGRGVLFATCERGYQTARSSVGLARGRWYFEVRIPPNGTPMSVGVVTKAFRAVSETSSSALGSCANSWGFDGSRLCRWHNGTRHEFSNRAKWKSRDVIGIAMDLEGGLLTCTHNGKPVSVSYDNLPSWQKSRGKASVTVFPAVSFSVSGCEVNFGGAPFAHELPRGYLPVDIRHYHLPPLLPLCTSLLCVHLASDLISPQAEVCGSIPEWLFLDADPEAVTSPENQVLRLPRDVFFVQSDGRRRSWDTELKAGEAPCLVRGSVAVQDGKWYFEVVIQGDGQVHLGWGALPFVQRSIGDDLLSWGIDGNQMMAKHNKHQRSLGRHPWRDGDVVGTFVDADAGTIGFTVNGQPLRDLHDTSGDGTLFHYHTSSTQQGGSVALVPLIYLEANASLCVFTADSDICFLPSGFAPIAKGPRWDAAVCERVSCGAALGQHFDNAASSTAANVSKRLLTAIAQATAKTMDFSTSSACFTTAEDQLRRQWSTVNLSLLASAGIEAGLDEHIPSPVVSAMRLLATFDVLLDTVARFMSANDAPIVLRSSQHSNRFAHPMSLSHAAHVMTHYASPVLRIGSLHAGLVASTLPAENAKLLLNRRMALSALGPSKATVSTGGSLPLQQGAVLKTLFGQMFTLVGKKSVAMFCTGKKLWSVSFAGEGADDVGGPYREALSAACTELMGASAIHMFVPSPNGVSNVGESRDSLIVNPRCLGEVSGAMFVFLGRLMGGCVRSGEPLPLRFAPHLWRMLSDHSCVPGDLNATDVSQWRSLRFVQSDDFNEEDMADTTFCTTDSSGFRRPLFEGSESVHLSASNREAFVALTAEARLKEESHPGWDLVCEGFHQVVPWALTTTLLPQEMEQLVAGHADFDVDLFLGAAKYEGLDRHDRRIVFLGNVLRGFSSHERSLFIRFVSGRERAPPGLRLKILASVHVTHEEFDDEHLPHASTCFFWLSLPNYSCEDVLRSKLSFAIHQCVDIDADFRVRPEEEEADASPSLVVRATEDDEEFEDYRHLL